MVYIYGIALSGDRPTTTDTQPIRRKIPGAGTQLVSPPTNDAPDNHDYDWLKPTQWQPGQQSPNPGGRPKGMTPGRVIRETVDPFKLVGILEEIASDPLERSNYRIDATVKLMEFGWGMAMTFAHVTTEDSTAVSLQAQYLEALRERLGLPAPTTVDGSVVHHNEAQPPQSPQPAQLPAQQKKRGRPRGAVDKQARKARQT